MTAALQVHVHLSPSIPTAVTDLPPDLDVRVWSPIATTILTGAREAVVVDPPLTNAQAAATVARVAATGRALTTVYVTHAHGDHWFGAAALLERFPAARVVALPAIAERARRQTPEDVAAFWEPRFPGGRDPDDAGGAGADGRRRARARGPRAGRGRARAHRHRRHQRLHVPSLGLVVAGDAVYDDVHLYLAESPADGRRAWRAALDVVDALAPRTVIAGHQRPGSTGDPAAIAETRRYLDDFDDLAAATAGPLELYRAMRARHPDRVNPGALWGSARAAFPAEAAA